MTGGRFLTSHGTLTARIVCSRVRCIVLDCICTVCAVGVRSV